MSQFTISTLNIHEAKKQIIVQALNARPTVKQSASALGICERSLWRFIKVFDIKKQKIKNSSYVYYIAEQPPKHLITKNAHSHHCRPQVHA